MVSKPSSSSGCLVPFSAKLFPNFTMVPGDPWLTPAERGPGGSHREQDPTAVPGVGELSGPRLVSEEGS